MNGVKRNVKDVCNELKKHPLVLDYKSGDPICNDIQCGNGPAIQLLMKLNVQDELTREEMVVLN